MRVWSLLVLAGVALACVPPPDAPVAPRTGTVASADGVPIAYDVRGTGDVALVFVHCWACDRGFWREQLDAFSDRYRVVSLDLAGHGESGAGRRPWTVRGLAADVVAVVEELGLERTVLVGHSMGGPVALEAAARLRGRVDGVLCLDTLHDVGTAAPAEVVAGLLERYRADYGGTMEAFVRASFPTETPASTVDWVAERARASRPEVALELLADFPALDVAALLAAAEVPVRCVNAAPHPRLGRPTAIESNRQHGDFDAVTVEGVGHFLLMEQPETVNVRLEEWLLRLAPDSGR